MALRHVIAIGLLAPTACFAGITAPGGALGGIEGSVPAGGFFAGTSISAAAAAQLASIAGFSPSELQGLVALARSSGTEAALANAASSLLGSQAALSTFADLAGVSVAEAAAILTALGGSTEEEG